MPPLSSTPSCQSVLQQQYEQSESARGKQRSAHV